MPLNKETKPNLKRHHEFTNHAEQAETDTRSIFYVDFNWFEFRILFLLRPLPYEGF